MSHPASSPGGPQREVRRPAIETDPKDAPQPSRESVHPWDSVAGVLAGAAGIVLLLGLLGLTKGQFISPLVGALRLWLGYGSFLLAILLIWAGVLLAAGRVGRLPRLNAPRLLGLEGALFCTLAVMALVGGLSTARAEAGLDGGRVGWGLAWPLSRVLPVPWPAILAGLLAGVLLLAGLGVLVPLFGALGARIEAAAEGDGRNVAGVELGARPDPGLPAPPKGGAPRAKAQRPARLSRPDPGGEVAGENMNFLERAKTEDTVQSGQIQRNAALPALELLAQDEALPVNENLTRRQAAQIEERLAEFGVPARVVGYRIGPRVTQFALEPGYVEKLGQDGQVSQQKVRVAQISALTRDLALALAAPSIRLETPVPGRAYIGLEVPNPQASLVHLRPILASQAFAQVHSPLALALGRDAAGQPVVADLARMPHLLIAGATNSGKSVCIASLATCLVMNNSPADLRLVLLDPKMVELTHFEGLPHVMGKVETEVERILGALSWAILEMEHRYQVFEKERARDFESYNQKMQRKGSPRLPRIVIIIDELADLMMTAPGQAEASLVHLAQLARATGIHLLVATQRPSTDIITGLIKANFPARISFAVASSVDSRVILDANGAENLLGKGDMLFLDPQEGRLQRAQGAYVSDDEINAVIAAWGQVWAKESADQKVPWEGSIAQDVGRDALFEEAAGLARRMETISTSWLQRRLRVGYPRAARLMDELEKEGIVGPAEGSGREREVLVHEEREEEDSE